jgi:hypothetical protein
MGKLSLKSPHLLRPFAEAKAKVVGLLKLDPKFTKFTKGWKYPAARPPNRDDPHKAGLKQ